ncbi:MAG: hypothetical protein JO023_27055 [Chloroflexi bacterium]|nr:hypothetical protein [Chloroflexota bacterium]
MTFKIGVMCGASGAIVRTFIARHAPQLQAAGIELAVVVLDDDLPARRAPVRHLWRLATRQARIAGCSAPVALGRILVYRALEGLGSEPGATPPFPAGLTIVQAPTLNASSAALAVRAAGCDLVCLMGARFLTRRTLRAVGAPVVNIHSSDPRRIRGGPVVVWEVLADEPQIALVVHEATEVLDAGAILAQASQPILYCGGLGVTTAATMAAARPIVADLFEQVIRDAADGTLRRTSFAPGPLKVTPSIAKSLRADLLCRYRSARWAATGSVREDGGTPPASDPPSGRS